VHPTPLILIESKKYDFSTNLNWIYLGSKFRFIRLIDIKKWICRIFTIIEHSKLFLDLPNSKVYKL
jgi:hypothetical protein